MHRFPGGADTKGFWHKQLPDHAPEWLPRWHDPHAEPGKTTTYLVVDEPAALVWAANFGALEWHAWTARTDHPDRPTYALIDIDPGPATVVGRGAGAGPAAPHRPGAPRGTGAAQADRAARDPDLDPRSPRDPASRRPGPGWSSCPGPSARWCRSQVSWKWDVRERGGLARLDYTQNTSNKTLVAPYSPRAAAGAPVSAPIEWDELDDPSLRPDCVHDPRPCPDRLARLGDPVPHRAGPGPGAPPDQLRSVTVNPPRRGSPARAEESPR